MNVVIKSKEFYRQKDGTDIIKVYTKPTKKFPEGANYFYVDAEDENVVDLYTWCLILHGKQPIVTARYGMMYGYRTTLLIHRELAHKHIGYYPSCIDHINRLEIDNTDANLNKVTKQQNGFNRASRGYLIDKRHNSFQPRILFNGTNLYPFSSVRTEIEACILQHQIETDYLKSLMKENYCQYNFLSDRRNDLGILELERTGQISAEEATYRHVLRYAGNAWYFYRYGLQEYFKDNNIPIPTYDLDKNGCMIHPVTGQKLCPY